MKKYLIFLILCIPFLESFQCGKGVNDFNLGGAFQIKAKVVNQNESINLGDSLQFVFEIPDTILLNGISTILIDKVGADVGEEVRFVDSTKPSGVDYPIPYNLVKIYVNPGTLINNYVRLTKIGSRLYANYYLIPKKKGVYMIYCGSIGGYFQGSSKDGKINGRVVFDFDVVDKHHYLIKKAMGSAADYGPMISDHESRGQGFYAFEVK